MIKEEVKNNYTIPMLTKVMELLEIVASDKLGFTMQELCNRMKCSKTTIYRILNTLWEQGYLVKNEETGRFYISKKILNIGLAALGEENIVELALDPMTRLRDEVKESVMLGALVGGKVVLLEQVLGSHFFTFTIKTGSRINIHSSAPGKVLFSAQNKEIQTKLLDKLSFEKFNENTLTKDEFLKEIEFTKQKGYGVDLEEEIYGVHCIAAPIHNRYGDVVASMWIAAPKGRLPEEDFDKTGYIIKKYADLVSKKLGWQ